MPSRLCPNGAGVLWEAGQPDTANSAAWHNGCRTPFSRLRLLSQLGVAVDIRADSTLADLQAKLPAIVGLHACWLSGYSVESQHAVVVTGVDPQRIMILDPAQGSDPVYLSENEFLAAWIEMDCIFAVMR